MKKDLYLQYFRNKGNEEELFYAESDVAQIAEFERIFGVDIDDAIMNEDKFKYYLMLSINNESLLYSIRRYVYTIENDCFLFGFYKEECICPDRFIFKGTRTKLIGVLSQMMEPKDAKTLAYLLPSHQEMLNWDESIEADKSGHMGGWGDFCYLIDEWNYNINIKALSLATIALMLDIKLKMGLVSTTLAIIGAGGRAVVKVDVEDAEKCLISEAIMRKSHIIDKYLFKETRHECVHNDYNCKFKENGMCVITEEHIVDVLDGLSQKNVFKKIGGAYKYNF